MVERTRPHLWVCLLVIAAMAVFVPVAAAKTGNLMFIFDASGSMWGQIDGKNKIVIAKEAMEKVVADLPDGLDVGLVAYGHRRKGDCDDVETLIPLARLDKRALLERVRAINPKGKTPMVRSIRKTADAIKHLEDETTILLISDGKETCDPDPCGFVAELKATGINFVLHVVGFDVGGEIEAQLKCMAGKGGGEYFPARDAGKLKEAISTVIEKTVEKNLKVSVFLNGKPIGGTVEVKNPNTGKRAAHRAHSEPTPLLLSVTPGTYTVTVTDDWQQEGRPSLVFENVRLNDKEVAEIKANFGSGTLKVWNIRNGKPFKGRVLVRAVDGEDTGGGYKTTFPDEPAKYILKPGQYKVVAEDSWGAGTKIDLGVVEINSGQTLEKKASFETGELVVWNVKKGKPFNGRVRVTTMDGETVGGGWATTYPDKPATYTLAPGQYKVVAEDSWGAGTRIDLGVVEISGGQTLEKKASFETGKLIVWTHKNGKPFHASVRVADKNDQTMGGGWGTTYVDRPETYALEPGIYSVVAEDAWGDPVVKFEFGYVEIKPGGTVNKICDFDSPPDQNQAPPAPTSAAPAAPAVTAASSQATPQAANAQGAQAASQAQAAQQVAQSSAQIQADAMAKANKSIAAGFAQMQAAMAGLKNAGIGLGNMGASQPTAPADTGGNTQVAGVQPGVQVGVQPGVQVGAQIDESKVGAADTGGGLDVEESPAQGHNPYEGMTDEQIRAAFAKDVGGQGPRGVAYDKTDWQLGKTWPLDCKRYEETLNNRLNTYTEEAQGMGRADVIERIKVARGNLEKLAKLRKKRPPKDVVQKALDRCVQEVHAIDVTIVQGQ